MERGGWLKYPENKPEPNKDGRHLVIIVNGDYHHVGIAYYHHNGRHWTQNGSPIESNPGTFVWCFKPLDDGYPIPPNSAAQGRMCMHALVPSLVDHDAI